MGCTYQRTQMCSFRKRKNFEHYSASISDGGTYYEGMSNDVWSSTKVIKSCSSSPDYHVNLRIKPFEVPDLVVEIPETTTVGSLKMTVLEAVNTILEGGLQVGVLLQGMRVTDDSKTLQQAGIFHSDKSDCLGFTLEPNTEHVPEKLACFKDPHLLSLGCATDSLDGKVCFAEVEALVQAVENLGTGRWRDVKLCAFQNEKHRTYVDLKDKWKTFSQDFPSAKKRRTGSSKSFRQGSLSPCPLVSATIQTPADIPSFKRDPIAPLLDSLPKRIEVISFM